MPGFCRSKPSYACVFEVLPKPGGPLCDFSHPNFESSHERQLAAADQLDLFIHWILAYHCLDTIPSDITDSCSSNLAVFFYSVSWKSSHKQTIFMPHPFYMGTVVCVPFTQSETCCRSRASQEVDRRLACHVGLQEGETGKPQSEL